ncbi:hypothetical protein [Thioalkalivibrio sp. AKL17]|uniref:hypothetical protein n=1 Tax=Thioalkalivibrio sp. AKL17 TaxID=1158160 RepID=UPI0012DD5CA4|nr:hypothetical protein [Thioalkalivibrio sp. AKL17]
MGLTDDFEKAKSRRDEYSARFWEQKGKYTYYTVSLPFALAGIAVASYPYPESPNLALVVAEIGAWLFLLSAGAAGLRAKWGEMEQSRKSSIIASGKMQRFEDGDPQDPDYARAVAQVAQSQQEQLRDAENAESFGSKWLPRLLFVGVCLWVASRSLMVLSA